MAERGGGLASRAVPVIYGAGGEVGVEDSDDNGRRVSEDGVVDDVQEFNQLQQTKTTRNRSNLRRFFTAVRNCQRRLTCSCQL